MTLNKAGADLIKSFEGCKLKAYQCSAKKWTIGYGNTFFEDGTPVKIGDAITQDKAEKMFELIANEFAGKVAKLVRLMSEVTFKKHRVFRETEAVVFYDISVENSNAQDLVCHTGPAISPPDRAAERRA